MGAREREKREAEGTGMLSDVKKKMQTARKERERETIISKNGIEKDITERRMEWNV